MIGLVLSVGLLVGLVAILVVLVGRRDRRERERLGLLLSEKPDPPVVDRAFDPALCAFCDEPRGYECRACRRSTCSEHRPWPAHAFCYPCEAEWRRGARRRDLIVVPIVIAAMTLVAAGFAGLVMATGARQLGIGALIGAIAIAAPLRIAIDRRLRRRFRPAGSLPRATITG